MAMQYKSTRSEGESVTASWAILKGLAEDGGLFVPDHIPLLEVSLSQLAGMSYQEVAYEVMRLFLTDFTEEELKSCIRQAYDEKFDTAAIAPLQKGEDAWYLELYHGPTLAFKDMALSILPYLMSTAAKKNQVKEEIVILTATSGDTGKAALAGFADVPGARIVVFYPKHGVSPIQERQMVTQKGANTCVAGITANFDAAQSAVKDMFHDPALREILAGGGFRFSSANSINIGRLVPQIAYYVFAYASLLAQGELTEGEPINIVVPTGNFGNILAAFYAKKMGLPVHKLVCASNENKVLYDFFSTGIYDRRRQFRLTSSPSMDILISSNLERLIYLLAQEDAGVCADLMGQLSQKGIYEISASMREGMQDFAAGFLDEAGTARIIRNVFQKEAYVVDPHTAVAVGVYETYRKESGDQTKTLIASTASPFKFTRSVMEALKQDSQNLDDFALADGLAALWKRKVPQPVEEIRTAPVLHNIVVEPEGMRKVVLDFLGIQK